MIQDYVDAKKYGINKYTTLENPYNGEIVVPFKNFPKSAIGNNGMFDMTNPNIYKGIIPAIGVGYGATQTKAYGGEINDNNGMKKYKSKYKKEQLPEFGWGSTIGGIAGGALGTLLGPFGTMAGSSLGAALGNAIDGEENTQGNQVQMPQLNIDPVNTQQFYNPVKAYGGYLQPNAEVEGDEVIQYQPGMQPQAQGQGNMQQIASDMSVAKGPTHANGGIPISAAPGSMVVSNRLPAPNTKEYKSIANKVEMLGRKKGQLEKKIERNPNDKIAKDTIRLVQKQIDTLIQQQEQMKVQNSQAIMAKAYQKAFGGTVTGNERLDKDFLNMWNTGSYAYGGGVPTEEEMYPGITNEYRKNVQNIKLNPDGTMNWGQTFAPQSNSYIPLQQNNTGTLS